MEESVFRLSVLPTLTELVVCGSGPVVGETKTAPLSISTGSLTQILRLTLPLSPPAEKFFEMKRTHAREAFDLYKKCPEKLESMKKFFELAEVCERGRSPGVTNAYGVFQIYPVTMETMFCSLILLEWRGTYLW